MIASTCLSGTQVETGYGKVQSKEDLLDLHDTTTKRLI